MGEGRGEDRKLIYASCPHLPSHVWVVVLDAQDVPFSHSPGTENSLSLGRARVGGLTEALGGFRLTQPSPEGGVRTPRSVCSRPRGAARPPRQCASPACARPSALRPLPLLSETRHPGATPVTLSAGGEGPLRGSLAWLRVSVALRLPIRLFSVNEPGPVLSVWGTSCKRLPQGASVPRGEAEYIDMNKYTKALLLVITPSEKILVSRLQPGDAAAGGLGWGPGISIVTKSHRMPRQA